MRARPKVSPIAGRQTETATTETKIMQDQVVKTLPNARPLRVVGGDDDRVWISNWETIVSMTMRDTYDVDVITDEQIYWAAPAPAFNPIRS